MSKKEYAVGLVVLAAGVGVAYCYGYREKIINQAWQLLNSVANSGPQTKASADTASTVSPQDASLETAVATKPPSPSGALPATGAARLFGSPKPSYERLQSLASSRVPSTDNLDQPRTPRNSVERMADAVTAHTAELQQCAARDKVTEDKQAKTVVVETAAPVATATPAATNNWLSSLLPPFLR